MLLRPRKQNTTLSVHSGFEIRKSYCSIVRALRPPAWLEPDCRILTPLASHAPPLRRHNFQVQKKEKKPCFIYLAIPDEISAKFHGRVGVTIGVVIGGLAIVDEFFVLEACR